MSEQIDKCIRIRYPCATGRKTKECGACIRGEFCMDRIRSVIESAQRNSRSEGEIFYQCMTVLVVMPSVSRLTE
jgi:hypothetical protein